MKSFRKVKLCWEVKLKRSESVHDFRFQMKVCKGKKVLLAPSGALVVIMVYYIPAAPTFSDFSNSSDSKVKVKVKGPNMCYIF